MAHGKKGGGRVARILDGARQNLVGPQVRRARLARGLSQQQLADRLETVAVYICRGSLSRIESGQRTVTDIELWGLSQVLNVPLTALFEE